MQAILEREGLQSAINFVGGYNYYQLRSLAILVTQHIFRSFFIMYYPFLNQAPVFLCRDPHNPENVYDCTENAGGCQEQILSPNSPQSLVVELGLYCEKSYVRTIAGLMFFVSQNIGSAYFCYVSDKSGRRASLLYSYLMYGIALLLLGLGSVGPITYIVFLMLVRGVSSSYSSISLTYLTEIGNQEFAKKATLIVLVGQTMAALSVVILAFFVTSWKTMLIYGIALPAILVCYSFRLLYETPEFLLGNKDVRGAANVLSSIADINNISIKPSSFFSPKKSTNVKENIINNKETKSWNYYQIMMNAELRKRVIPYSVIKLYLYMAFYGSLFAVSSLGGNIHVNLIVAGIAELIGYVLSVKAPEYSYYKLLQVSLKITSATGIGFLLIPSLSCEDSFVCSPLVIQGFLALILRASICFIYGFIYGLGNEMFPAEVRSQSIGISDIFSALGGMCCPFIILFAERNNLNPLFLFGISGMIALYANQYLPDVKEPIPGFTDEKEEIEMSYVKMKDLESN